MFHCWVQNNAAIWQSTNGSGTYWGDYFGSPSNCPNGWLATAIHPPASGVNFAHVLPGYTMCADPPPPPPPAPITVGTTPGSFSVNPNGGANYSIPITAPPGTAGLTPSISLNYDRQVKSELLGVAGPLAAYPSSSAVVLPSPLMAKRAGSTTTITTNTASTANA